MNLAALALVAAGWLLCWSAVNDPVGGPVQVFRDIVAGNLPTPGEQVRTARSIGQVGAQAAGAVAGVINRGRAGWHLDGTRPNTRAGAEILGARFGIKTIGGVRADPLPDHPSGRAADFMINDVENGFAIGQALASYAQANAAALHVNYIIWNQRIWSVARAREGWRAYSMAAVSPHTDHVHITFD